MCRLILRTPSIQLHALKQLNASMRTFSDITSLIQVSSWTLGKFATVNDNFIESLKKLMILP
jgi:hypothetical protein